ncbi:MAG: hypothetical protein LBK95_16600 [Bifidobacteriaceae bacterium]|jgi:hypothetical protein|nr:hypothetical protein [Bifidobacteriaceae bacterium]
MKQATVTTAALREAKRFDAKYFTSDGWSLRSFLRTAGTTLRAIAGKGGIGAVEAPPRFKRVYAAPTEASVPYLRSYDVFEYLPPAADHLAAQSQTSIKPYRIEEGLILQTCSGRNLGPLTIADEYLSGFVLSHDMLRIAIDDEALRYYVLGFLRSASGQRLLRGDDSGSVVNHLTPTHVSELTLPIFDCAVDQVAGLVKDAFTTRAAARRTLADTIASVDQAFPVPRLKSRSLGWGVTASALNGRLDAAYHDPVVAEARSLLSGAGGVAIGDAATVRKPAGRYKTAYVRRHEGLPLLSGRQLLQADVVALKYLSRGAIANPGDYALGLHDVCFQADGRAEENLGTPVCINSARQGWLASGHVARVRALDPAEAGWLWAAIASPIVQYQIAALAAGSVVDALYEDDVAGVLLPPPDRIDSAAVVAAWEAFARAEELEAQARVLIEDLIPAK